MIWQILYIIVAVLIAFIIPFAFFFYENDVDEDAETNGFFETQTGGAIKYTLLVAIVFCVVLGIMYAFLNKANVPVTRYAQTFTMSQDVKVSNSLIVTIPSTKASGKPGPNIPVAEACIKDAIIPEVSDICRAQHQ